MSSLLITGGTGTVGKAVAREALDRGYTRVCIYSRDEHKQALMRDELGDDERLRWFLGDVRDRERLRRALQGVGSVIHAAALKRVEAGEYNPGEFVKTNVLGTLNLIEAAQDADVQKVVGISTDKAFNPQNAYGATKLLMEKLLLAANNARGDYGPRFAVTRFGNVMGSRGSVLENWLALKAAGAKSLPVTDPRCTRYWLRQEEAVGNVMQTLAVMPPEPIALTLSGFLITDLALALQMPWHEVGLRAGESLHESMGYGDSSDTAQRMRLGEIMERLNIPVVAEAEARLTEQLKRWAG